MRNEDVSNNEFLVARRVRLHAAEHNAKRLLVAVGRAQRVCAVSVIERQSGEKRGGE